MDCSTPCTDRVVRNTFLKFGDSDVLDQRMFPDQWTLSGDKSSNTRCSLLGATVIIPELSFWFVGCWYSRKKGEQNRCCTNNGLVSNRSIWHLCHLSKSKEKLPRQVVGHLVN